MLKKSLTEYSLFFYKNINNIFKKICNKFLINIHLRSNPKSFHRSLNYII